MKFLKNELIRNRNQRDYIVFLIIILFAILSFPPILQNPSSGLDGSWILGLELAQLENFVWGEDLSFTYGPLSYLYRPLNIDQSLWIDAVIFRIFSYALFYLVLGIFVAKTNSPIRNSIILGSISVILVTQTFVYFPISGLLLSFYLYLQYSKNYKILIPIIFVSSFLFFLKFDVALMSMSILILSCIFLLIEKRYKELAICAVLYTSFIFLIWFSLTGSFTGIENYFSHSFSVASDYSEGASTITPTSFFVYSIIPGTIIFLAWTYEFWKKEKPNLKFMLISFFVLFAFYKLGFVREGHMHIFFISWAFLLFSIYALSKKNNVNKILKISTWLMIAFFMILFFTTIAGKSQKLTVDSNFSEWVEVVGNTASGYYTSLKIIKLVTQGEYLFDDEKYQPIRNQIKNSIKESYPPLSDTIIDKIQNNPVNVYPWDISLLYAYDLNWKPSPLMQNYVGINEFLDNLEADFYSEKSTEYILFKIKSIDKRHPAFTEPSTLRAILCNYHVEEKVKQFYLLEKKIMKIFVLKWNLFLNVPLLLMRKLTLLQIMME